jgi:hypothetical protein
VSEPAILKVLADEIVVGDIIQWVGRPALVQDILVIDGRRPGRRFTVDTIISSGETRHVRLHWYDSELVRLYRHSEWLRSQPWYLNWVGLRQVARAEMD